MRFSPWTIAGVQEALEALLADGCTAGEAAKALSTRFRINISRNAVIGRAFRSAVPLKRAHRRQYTDEQRIAVAAKKAERIRLRLEMAARVIERDRSKREETMSEPKPRGDVEHGCRYLHGEPSKRKFCGAEVKPLTSWCAYHYAAVFLPTKKPEQLERVA